MINIMYAVDPIKRIVKPMSPHAVTEQDHEASSLRFAFPDNITGTGLDSTGTAVRVMYIRPDGGDPVAKTLTFYKHSGGYYLYDWNLQKSDLQKEGHLVFSLCILDISSGEVSEWHTTPCAVRVLSTIHTDDSDEGDDTITPTVKERVAVLETMIQRVASGAPIVVSSTSAMTDTNQIYVLSTNGRWYYHNGSAWVAGGEYGGVANGSVATDKLADGAVTTAKIADGAVTIEKLSSDIAFCAPQSVSVDIAGSWNGDFTNGVITPADVSLSVFAACVPGIQYTISKTPTQRFSVFFTDQYPQIGLPIMEYRIIDQKTAASITAVAPEGAKYICAYVYNRNTDSGYGTKEEVMASVNIVAQSAVDMIARDEIKRIDEIEKTLYGRNITLKWEHGGIGLDGALQSDENRIRTRLLITKSDTPTDIILSGSTYQFSVRYYDSNGGFLSSDTVWRSASLYDVFSQVENCEAIKIVSRLSTNTTMTDTDMENAQSALSVSISSISDAVIPSSVRQAIYNLFAHAAYSTTANVSNDIATLQSWAEVE